MDLMTWEEHIYNSTFESTFDALLNDFKAGILSIEDLKMNIDEHHNILLNASNEGAARFQHCTALIDAHEYALALISKGSL